MKALRLLVLLPFVALTTGAAPRFPEPDRPVASIIADQWSDESSRDAAREAEQVMVFLGTRPGMVIADIGAGSGYYTVRLAPRLAPTGRVIAEDIVPAYVRDLRARVRKLGLRNVTVIQGTAENPRLPLNAVDAALMVHMYHEVRQPYALLWHVRGALRKGGKVAIVDIDRPTRDHGTPKAQLACELAAVGFRRIGDLDLGAAGGYLAVFEPVGPRIAPSRIKPCRSAAN